MAYKIFKIIGIMGIVEGSISLIADILIERFVSHSFAIIGLGTFLIIASSKIKELEDKTEP